MIRLFRWIQRNIFCVDKCPKCKKYTLDTGYIGEICECGYYKIY